MKIKKEDLQKDKKFIMIMVPIILVWIGLIIVLAKYPVRAEGIVPASTEITEIEKINQVDVNSILEENRKSDIHEEKMTEVVDLEYTTTYEQTNELAKGKMQVVQEGRDGKQEVVVTKTYQGEELIKEEQTGSVIIEGSVNKIVKIGTGNFKDNTKLKKGDILYVVSETMEIRQEASKDSEKLITLPKNKEVTFLQKKDSWYQIRYSSYTGWVDGACLTNKKQEELKEESTTSNGGITKQQALAKLSKDMDLRTPSGLSVEQFKKILSGITEDKNKIFENNAEYFYYIEKQYKINGIFVAAVAIHESGWGTSKIATNKNNLFGYGANDSNPYGNAYNFKNYAEGIDLIARVFVKYYLNPSGTKIYEGEVASGKYYSGTTLTAVNKKYATDKNWNTAVYKWMSYLYNRI